MNVMPLRRVDGVPAPLPLPELHRSAMLHVDTVKFLADGGLSGATAALSVNYRHAPHKGLLRFEHDELLALCRESHDAGWRIATHAIGDVAIEQMLDIYEALGPRRSGGGHRLEHLGLPSAAQLARAARLGVIAVPQAIFLHELGRNFRHYLPDALLPRCYPLRAMLDAGVTVALSSDAPVVENDNPLAGMTAAITRRDRAGEPLVPEQAITAAEALDAYTRGGAASVDLEHELGTIARGYRADLAVLSGNPAHHAARGPVGTHRGHDDAGRHNRLRTLMTSNKQLIDGQWSDAANGGTWDVLNPATEEVVATVPYGTAEDCERAIDAAARAFIDWCRTTPYERGAVLDRTASLIRAEADTLARTTVLESGKPLVQARGEWLAAADLFEWFAEEGKRAYGRIIPARTPSKRLLVLKQPLGVVGLITAWNFPAWNIARAGGAALAAGCTIVVRPSEYTPLSGMNVARLLTEAGAPPASSISSTASRARWARRCWRIRRWPRSTSPAARASADC